MKITVFGATGGTGQHVVRQALAAGQHVTAVVRDPSRLPVPVHPQLDVVTADVMDPEAIVASLVGRDVAISTLGPRGSGPQRVCSEGVRSIVAAMRQAGLRRLVVVTASGHVVDDGDGLVTRVLIKPLVGRVLRHQFADFVRTEKIVRDSGLDWTMMRPPQLTDGDRRPYRTAIDRNLRRGFRLSRADLAAATLDAVREPATAGHTIGLGY